MGIFDRSEALLGKEALEKLKGSTVAVFGIGGVVSVLLAFAEGIVIVIEFGIVILGIIGNNRTVFNHDYAFAKIANELMLVGYHYNCSASAVDFGKKLYDFV